MAYVDDIIAALGNTRPDTKKYADIIAEAATKSKKQQMPDVPDIPYTPFPEVPVNNVSVVDESYNYGGLNPSDFLIPNKPNIDWNTEGVSYAGGLGFDTTDKATEAADVISGILTPMETNAEAQASVPSFAGDVYTDVNIDTKPQRKRLTKMGEAIANATDIWDMVHGDTGAYVGRTMERLNAYDKARMEQDPEGYQADLNRAKILSQKAYDETDPAKKAIYGREIKKLLPKETQGLDDLTAAEYFTANADEKLRLQLLKNQGALEKQRMANEGKLDLATLQNTSKEKIAEMQNDTKWDIAKLNNEYKQAIADGNNERAITVAQMITDRQATLADLNNAAKLKQEEVRQAGQTERTAMQQAGAMERVQAQQAGALERVQAQQAGALERAQVTSTAKSAAAGGADLIAERTSPEVISNLKALNQKAGRWISEYTYAAGAGRNSESAQAYQQFEGIAKQMVQDQLRKIYGAQFTEKEGERFFKSMGLNPKMDPAVRWTLFENAINDLRAKSGYGPISSGTSQKTIKAGAIYKGYRFKGGNPKDKNNWEKV